MSNILIEIAGLRIRCELLHNHPFNCVLTKRYSQFVSSKTPLISMSVNFKKGNANPFKPALKFKNGILEIKRGDFHCVLNLKSKNVAGELPCNTFVAGELPCDIVAGELPCDTFVAGELPFAKKGFLEIVPQIQSFDSFLRTFYSWLLIQNNGILLHSAGISNPVRPRRCNGYLFAGKSGAGKSTIARYLASHKSPSFAKRLPPSPRLRRTGRKGRHVTSHKILSDELIPLRIIDGKVKIYPSPFWGEMKNSGQWSAASGQNIKLEKIFFLKKAKANKSNQISRKEFYKRMLACIMNFSKQEQDAKKVLKTIDTLADKIQYFELKFSTTNPHWIETMRV